ncbi:toprim domain-containing protein [Streptomyces sp. NPDC057235]|uniref:toprim domain-containing protein n=1 Tax=Streptomyces sp. NPDC057235 TaxID=3346058 RepID=UPI0036435469
MNTLTSEQRLFFEQAVSTYQQDLAADQAALSYLAKRGFGPEVAQAYRLGIVRRPLVGHESYAGRLALPYLTPAGAVNLRFRCLRQHVCKDEGCPKYLSIDGMESNLFNVLDLKKDSPHIGVTEGELDAMTLSICGIPAVGVPGVENWQSHFGRCLADFDLVYSFADGDKAGKSFGRFLAREAKARPVRVPKGQDINSIFQEGGADAVRALIAG